MFYYCKLRRSKSIGFDTSALIDILYIHAISRSLAMPTQLLIRLDDDLKERLSGLARSEGKTTSQMVRELIRGYIKERDIASYVDGLWSRIGAKLASRGVKPSDVSTAVSAARKRRG
jgi:hypothetical protein